MQAHVSTLSIAGHLCPFVNPRRSSFGRCFHPSSQSRWQQQQNKKVPVFASGPTDVFTLGQSIFEAGSQTLQRFGRQFEPRPPGFPGGGNLVLTLHALPHQNALSSHEMCLWLGKMLRRAFNCDSNTFSVYQGNCRTPFIVQDFSLSS